MRRIARHEKNHPPTTEGTTTATEGTTTTTTTTTTTAVTITAADAPYRRRRRGQLMDNVPKEIFGPTFHHAHKREPGPPTRLVEICDKGAEPQKSFRGVQTAMRKTALKEGSCFKAVRVACNRQSRKRIEVMAEEIHIVVDDDNHESASHIETDSRRFSDRSCYEKRKIITALSFDVATPLMYLKLKESENGTKIIDVTRGPLKSKYFPPMRYTEGKGYRETRAADVLFGIDLAEGSPWITPIAFQHVNKVRECVQEAGGVFVADFDTTVGGWARFRSVYVSPSPYKTVYVQACKLKPSSRFFGGARDVVPSLSSAGGVFFKQAFEPTQTGLDDPVIFNDLDLGLLDYSA